jgi:hypothetical protein
LLDMLGERGVVERVNRGKEIVGNRMGHMHGAENVQRSQIESPSILLHAS